jgi:FHS family L-fucose permease-like MFS transporter
LETAANPYITVLGAPENAAFRINLAQSFNGLAAMTAGFVGRTFILSGITLTDAQEKAMSPAQLQSYLNGEAASVKMPFLIVGLGVLLVVILISRTPLPAIVEEGEGEDLHESRPFLERMSVLLKEKELMAGVLAQFCYVGAQACIWSFFVLFAERVASMDEKTASLFLIIGSALFMVGRFAGTLLMKVISPVKLLTIYSFLNVLLLALAILLHGNLPVYALLAADFFMSIMFPTIFSLSIRGLGKKTKEGSSLVIMSIVGGAVCALILGRIADATNIQWAYAIPGLCFVYIFIYSWKRMKTEDLTLTAGH